MEYLLTMASGVLIGVVSALAGIGGGTLMVPFMTLILGINAKVAVASSLMTVIITSSSAAYVYLKDNMVNMKVALSLTPATCLGAVIGSHITISLPQEDVKKLLGYGLIIISLMMIFGKTREASGRVKKIKEGSSASFIAGLMSGMLGIGGGVLKVPIMNLVMDLPIKEAVATSAFMIGLTASTGTMVYLAKGLVDPGLVAGFALGIIPGATLGAKLLKGAKPKAIKTIFSLILLYAGIKLVLG